mmetsp:Transcript_158710/g.281335  ORF Transcript_158710/g.281335 Transcript_158710/m.281335 type:complete len:252 (+) Transcript_158710:1724-2479(+)
MLEGRPRISHSRRNSATGSCFQTNACVRRLMRCSFLGWASTGTPNRLHCAVTSARLRCDAESTESRTPCAIVRFPKRQTGIPLASQEASASKRNSTPRLSSERLATLAARSARAAQASRSSCRRNLRQTSTSLREDSSSSLLIPGAGAKPRTLYSFFSVDAGLRSRRCSSFSKRAALCGFSKLSIGICLDLQELLRSAISSSVSASASASSSSSSAQAISEPASAGRSRALHAAARLSRGMAQPSQPAGAG